MGKKQKKLTKEEEEEKIRELKDELEGLENENKDLKAFVEGCRDAVHKLESGDKNESKGGKKESKPTESKKESKTTESKGGKKESKTTESKGNKKESAEDVPYPVELKKIEEMLKSGLGDDGEKLKKSAIKKLTKRKAFLEKKILKGSTGKKSQKKKDGKSKEKRNKTDIKSIDFVDKTVPGEKKILNFEMNKYHPKYVESSWYQWWEKSNFFRADENSDQDPFVIMLPPPNVTGKLHIGHALTVSIQDCLARYWRMKGKNVLYLPGIDHAGIATQVVVEKQLMRETGKTRHDIGRQEFVNKVWEWKKQYGASINDQLRRTGATLDWSREVFTMDDNLSAAVKEAFIRLYKKGDVYRSNRLVNWDCTLNTAISNIEVDHIEVEKPQRIPVPGLEQGVEVGYLWSFAYPIEGGGEIVIATTRPETLLGDTAIAVHPDDSRYTNFVGKFCIHPFNGRKLPIIADSFVKKDFGSGAVKITPAHDPNDFDCGKRNNLEFINILNDDGFINENGIPFVGEHRFVVREKIIAQMEEKKLYRGKVPNEMSIGICSRSKDIIEPVVKPQWFVDCTESAKKAVDAVRNGELTIHPKKSEKTWFQWLENIQPWCVSRQLWWGHRIPAYYATFSGDGDDPLEALKEKERWIVANDINEATEIACEKFNLSKDQFSLKQDDDVLDTWFSSGLFPFSTLGWPNEQAQDFKTFFPNSTLETGKDILFFWVARMVMQSYQLTDKLPFKNIILHPMVRDKFGRKMSKSLGNVIDPIDCIEGASLEHLEKSIMSGNLPKNEVELALVNNKDQFPTGIPECGTDALRFALLNYTGQLNDIALDTDRIFTFRAFCNKMWNAVNFALEFFGLKDLKSTEVTLPKFSELSFLNQWILTRLRMTIEDCNSSIQESRFADYTNSVFNFFLHDVCDQYLEAIKGQQDEITQKVLYQCLEITFRLLHPTMPYITEELWQRLPEPSSRKTSIVISSYPEVDEVQIEESNVIEEMDFAMEVIRKIRSKKSEFNLPQKKKPQCWIQSAAEEFAILTKCQSVIETLSYVSDISVTKEDEIPEGSVSAVLTGKSCAYLMVKGLIDFTKEKARTAKKLKVVERSLSSLEKKMNSPHYSKVPENVREQDTNDLKRYQQEVSQYKDVIQYFEKMETESTV